MVGVAAHCLLGKTNQTALAGSSIAESAKRYCNNLCYKGILTLTHDSAFEEGPCMLVWKRQALLIFMMKKCHWASCMITNAPSISPNALK